MILYWSCLSKPGFEKSNLVTTIERWGPDFEISFKLKVNKMPPSGPWHSVLQMTTGQFCCWAGTRIPGVWLFASYGKPILHTSIAMTRDAKAGNFELELNKVYTVLLTQIGGTFKVTVDGSVVWQHQTGIASEPFTDVKYYLSNPSNPSAGDLAQITTPLLASPQQWDGQWDGMGQRKLIPDTGDDYY